MVTVGETGIVTNKLSEALNHFSVLFTPVQPVAVSVVEIPEQVVIPDVDVGVGGFITTTSTLSLCGEVQTDSSGLNFSQVA